MARVCYLSAVKSSTSASLRFSRTTAASYVGVVSDGWKQNRFTNPKTVKYVMIRHNLYIELPNS